MPTSTEPQSVIDPKSGLLVGLPVDSPEAIYPVPITLKGRLITLIPIDPDAHSKVLFETTSNIPEKHKLWQYMLDGPWDTYESFYQAVVGWKAAKDYLCFTILSNETSQPVGLVSYLNIRLAYRVIEVGSVLFSPALQKTAGATEAMYLMAKHAIEDLHYLRYEWKANVLNKPSRKAAERLGFLYEGTFRSHMIIKGHNRDTVWFSMIHTDWPTRKEAFEEYLAPGNFDESGQQRKALRRRDV
jgi:RimJ/RimL family protein N-acetyltransferase